MIYINTVQTNRPMTEIKTVRDFDFFKTYKPQRFEYPTTEEQENAIKLFRMKIIIAGQMTGDLKRNNTNVFSRSLLFIDFDSVHETEEAFLSKIKKELKSTNYCLYPTLRYRKDNIRYRLVLELSRPVNSGEYEKLLFGICKELGVKFTFDSSNKTWSQGQAAPVITQHSDNVGLIFHDAGEPIPVDGFLHRISNMKEYKKEIQQQKKMGRGEFFTTNYHNQHGNGKGKTIQLLEEVVQGVREPGRNSFFTRAFGTLLKANMEIEAAIALMIDWNDNYVEPPLDPGELHSVIESIVGRENKKERGD